MVKDFTDIHSDADVSALAEGLIDATTKEGSENNEFFTLAEKMFFTACIYYQKDFSEDDSEKGFDGVLKMINKAWIENDDLGAALDAVFDKVPHDAQAWKYYNASVQAAGKTRKQILISCMARLQAYCGMQ